MSIVPALDPIASSGASGRRGRQAWAPGARAALGIRWERHNHDPGVLALVLRGFEWYRAQSAAVLEKLDPDVRQEVARLLARIEKLESGLRLAGEYFCVAPPDELQELRL